MEETTLAPNRRLLSLQTTQKVLWARLPQIVMVICRFSITVYLITVPILLLLRLVTGDRYWLLALVNTFVIWLFLPLPLIIGLALFLRRRWLIAGSFILLLIALVWLSPTYFPKAAPQPTDDTLKIVDFNVWPSNPRVRDAMTWIRDQSADVVLLQDTPGFISGRGVPSLRDLYPYQYVENTGLGSVVLSRVPFLSTENIPVGKNHMFVQRVTLDLNGQTIAIYNVHLSNPFRGTPRFPMNRLGRSSALLSMAFAYDAEGRDAEIADLLAAIRKESLPYLVAGDFNTSDQSLIYNDITAHMIDSFRERGIGPGTSWPAGGEAGWPRFILPLIRIDYLLHSADWTTIAISQSPKLGSDHLGLTATLSFTHAK